MGTPLSAPCCGGRAEKMAGNAGRDRIEEPAKEPTKTAEPGHRAQKRGVLFKKMGKSCCCGNLGDKVQRESAAPKPQPAPRDLDEPEGEPGWPGAVNLTGARKSGKHQDLNGKWVLSQIDGDMDKLLIESGKGWFIRRAAQAINYGQDFVELHITQDGDAVKLKKKHTSGSWSIKQWTAGCEGESMDELGPMRVTMDYDTAGALTFACTFTATGFCFFVRRIRHSPEELHEFFTSSNGLLIKQTYTLIET